MSFDRQPFPGLQVDLVAFHADRARRAGQVFYSPRPHVRRKPVVQAAPPRPPSTPVCPVCVVPMVTTPGSGTKCPICQRPA